MILMVRNHQNCVNTFASEMDVVSYHQIVSWVTSLENI